jgi:hypothetical protein
VGNGADFGDQGKGLAVLMVYAESVSSLTARNHRVPNTSFSNALYFDQFSSPIAPQIVLDDVVDTELYLLKKVLQPNA